MKKKPKSKPGKKVLEDYKRQGTKFIPPMTHKLGQMKSTSYARQTLPELVWWDVLAEEVSAQFAINLAGAVGEHLKGRTGQFTLLYRLFGINKRLLSHR